MTGLQDAPADAAAERPGDAVVRDAAEADYPAVQEIYAHHVLHGVASFEETPPALDEIARRAAEIAAAGLPFLVAELDGAVRGFAYAGPFRPRSAYRYTVEDSVYIAPGFESRGLGRRLLAELVERCGALGVRQMVAVIGGGSAASVRLHAGHGFQPVGRLPSVGLKFGAWRDLVIMQRSLGGGGDDVPEG